MEGSNRQSPLLKAAIEAREREQYQARSEQGWRPTCRYCGRRVVGDEEDSGAHEGCARQARVSGVQLRLDGMR